MTTLFITVDADYSRGDPPCWHARVFREDNWNEHVWKCQHNHKSHIAAGRCGQNAIGRVRRQLRTAGQDVSS